jgi:hypothetical protein
MVFHVSATRADYLRKAWSNIAVDVVVVVCSTWTNGWNDQPAVGDAVFVVTHQPPTDWPYPQAPFTFVTDGVPSALAHRPWPVRETCRQQPATSPDRHSRLG